jgi:hypothetical protein
MSLVKSRHQLSRPAEWRNVLSVLLVALVAFAPIARAVCDLQHIATVTAGVHDGIATDGPSSPDSDNHDSCCDDGSVSMTTEARTGAADAKAAISLPALHLASAASSYLALTAARFESSGRQPLPPYESTFRRVPKLLI